MATNKSNTRTVLNTTLTGATSYSSGALAVGDLYELAVDFHVTAVTTTGGNPEFLIGRIGADGNVYYFNGANISSVTDASLSLGAGLSTNPSSFGDQIRVDLVCPAGSSVSTTISILGKG